MAIDGIDAQLRGLEPILVRMRNLPSKLQKRGAQRAARAGANVIRAAARESWRGLDDPTTAASIQKNVAVQAAPRYGRSVGGVVMRVGIRGGAKQYVDSGENRRRGRVGRTYAVGGNIASTGPNPGGDTWYWRFHELGTSRIAAKNFMLKALQNNLERATAATALVLSREIDRAVT